MYITIHYDNYNSLLFKMTELLKIIVAGSGGIGKTSMLNKWCNGYFDEREDMTIGTDFFVKRLEVNGSFINLQIWDFAGQKQFRFFLEDFVKGAIGSILAFDVQRNVSFFELDEWITMLREELPDLPVVLVATKIDQHYHPTITPEMGREFAKQNKLIDFVETSAKLGYNIETPFRLLIDHFLFKR